MKNEQLIEFLDSIGVEYELDSSNPGMTTSTGEHVCFSELKSPSEYLKQKNERGCNDGIRI